MLMFVLIMVRFHFVVTLSLGQQCDERSQGCRGSTQAGSGCKSQDELVEHEVDDDDEHDDDEEEEQEDIYNNKKT